MDNNKTVAEPTFFARLGTAFACFIRALGSGKFCREVEPLLRGEKPQAPVPVEKKIELPPEKQHASALLVLSMLQREGRLIDFLQEDVAGYADADVGAAARVLHAGCRKVLAQTLSLEPVLRDAEGSTITVPSGFDAQRIRVTGNVAGQPPFKGSLKHHGWVTKEVRFPTVSETLDARILAPAEVEI
jgi:hypothetical protein